MKAIVKAHKETGKVVTRATSAKGNEYGTIMIQQTTLVTENGFLVPKNRCAFIRIAEQHLDAMEAVLSDGIEYPSAGKIVRTESFTPLYEGQSAKINPETKEEFLLNGRKVYFQDEWSSDINAQDKLLSAAPIAEAVSEEEGV